MSTCESQRHAEYDCFVKWSVSGRRFTQDKWCDPCRAKLNGARHAKASTN